MRFAATLPRATEADLGALFVERVPYVLPHVRVYRRNILDVKAQRPNGSWFRAVAGVPGQGDYYCLAQGGLHVEIETKAATGRMREAQLAWRAHCLRFEIPHLVLRAARQESPDATVTRWIDELRKCLARKVHPWQP